MNRLAVIAILFVGPVSASAAPPSLDDLVKECEKYELPFPAQGTKFVIYESGYDDFDQEQTPFRVSRHFAFLTREKSRTNPHAEFYLGFDRENLARTARIRVVPTEPESLVNFWLSEDFNDVAKIVFAHKLGHLRLAEFLLERYRWCLHTVDPIDDIRLTALQYWLRQITKPDYDRPQIIRNLKRLTGVSNCDWDKLTWHVIESLELAERHRSERAQPIEQLIDQLTKAKPDTFLDQIRGYGFDAVPYLIVALDDRRMAYRSHQRDNAGIHPQCMTVGDVAVMLLSEFAGEFFVLGDEPSPTNKPSVELPFYFNASVNPNQKAAIIAWAKSALSKNEKDFFLNRLNPDVDEMTEPVDWPALCVIRKKYPQELPGLYRRMLKCPKFFSTNSVIEAIIDSKSLPDDVKRDCLQLGLDHTVGTYRDDAFRALARFDPKAFNTRLHEMIKRLPEVNWDKTEERDEFENLLSRCYDSQDPAVWPVMARSLRRCSAWVCVNFLEQCDLSRGELHRQDQIRMLAAFLHDRTIRPVSDSKREDWKYSNNRYGAIELRQFVCYQLSYFFGEVVLHDPTRTPDEWAFIDKWIKTEVEKELGKSTLRNRR